MARKKIVREPVEKLSSDNIVEITEDSSEEEEEDTAPMIKPKVKKPRSDAQLANDQKMRDRKKKKVVADESLDVSTHPVKSVSIAIDDDDKPMTKKEMLELMAQQNAKPAPIKKPRKRATKAEMVARKTEKVIVETPPTPPPPTPPLKRAKPEMLWV